MNRNLEFRTQSSEYSARLHASPTPSERTDTPPSTPDMLTGATLVPIDLEAELSEVLGLRLAIVPVEFTQHFGDDDESRRENWERALPLMGSNVHRNALGLEVSGGDYLRAVRRVGSLRLEVEAKLAAAGITALLTPTV